MPQVQSIYEHYEKKLKASIEAQNTLYRVDIWTHEGASEKVSEILMHTASKINASLAYNLANKNVEKAVKAAFTTFGNIITDASMNLIPNIKKSDAKMLTIADFQRSDGNWQINLNQIKGARFQYTVKFIIYVTA